MKLKTIAENPLEWIALKLNLAPMPLVDTQVAFNAARAIMAGAELGIYDAIGKGEMSAEEVASACSTHVKATKQLMDCLVGVGYLQWNGGRYSLKKKYQKWLLKENESNLIGKLRFQLYEWNYMTHLEEYVRTGRPMELHGSISPEEWTSYQEGMRDLSINASRELAGKLPLPDGAKHMLDIGGSHGLFSIALCEKHSALNSTILELPGALEAARSIASRYDRTGRIMYEAGNALKDDLGENKFDLIMINNVVHHFTQDQNILLAGKMAKALKPGGICAIGEFIRSQKPGEGGVVASTSGLYFSLISESGTWSEEEMQSWLNGASLTRGKTISLMSIPGWKMVVGKKN